MARRIALKQPNGVQKNGAPTLPNKALLTGKNQSVMLPLLIIDNKIEIVFYVSQKTLNFILFFWIVQNTGSVTIDTKEYETTCQEKSNGTVTLAIILANLGVDPGGTESYQYLVKQAQPGTYKISPFFIPKISLETVR